MTQRLEQLARDLLADAGEPEPQGPLVIEPLSGGRTGAPVFRASTGPHSYVVKQTPEEGWRDEALQCTPGAEVALWESGFMRALPAPLSGATLYGTRRDDHWTLLMRDVGAGIRPRGQFSDDDERALLDGLAGMHARYWNHPELASMPLATMAGTTRLFADTVVAHTDGDEAIRNAPEWLRTFLQDFKVLPFLLPRFLELLGNEHADAYIELARDRDWERVLDDGPQTAVHGDLRRANIAFLDGGVCLFDWEFAARGPAATDLAWHWFLHFWAYPPDDRDPNRPELVSYYLARLEDRLGTAFDREQFERHWRIAWVRAMVQIGYCLADATFGDSVTADDVERCKQRCIAAVGQARAALAA